MQIKVAAETKDEENVLTLRNGCNFISLL